MSDAASHDLLRFRTGAVLEVEQAVVRGGLREASLVASEAVTDSPRHPQHVVTRVAEGYLVVAGVSNRPAVRLITLTVALVVLGAVARRFSRRGRT